MNKKCPRCKSVKPVGEFYKNAARRDGLAPWCAVCFLEAGKESRQKLRRQVIEHLGGCCAKCGYDADIRALQIDHVAGDGHIERRNGVVNNKMLRAALADTNNRYQLLCANCNFIKRIENNEHRGKDTYQTDRPTELIERENLRWTAEQREKQAARTKALWQDPEHRAAMSKLRSDLMKRRWASGEVPSRPRAQKQET